jgi:hypothetical protein
VGYCKMQNVKCKLQNEDGEPTIVVHAAGSGKAVSRR